MLRIRDCIWLSAIPVLMLFSAMGAAAGNLTGMYDAGTLTQLQRPEAFGNNLYLSQEDGERTAQQAQQSRKQAKAKTRCVP